jgi:hypothetical protein
MVKIGQTDPFTPQKADALAVQPWSRSEWASLLSLVAVAAAAGLLLKWFSDRSDPQFLLYALLAANAVPFLWNTRESDDGQEEEDRTWLSSLRKLLRLIVENAFHLVLLPVGWRLRSRIELPEGTTWSELGFAACYALAAVLAAQVLYRVVYKGFVNRQNRQNATARWRDTTFPRL